MATTEVLASSAAGVCVEQALPVDGEPPGAGAVDPAGGHDLDVQSLVRGGGLEGLRVSSVR
jgi:hypothetical protein